MARIVTGTVTDPFAWNPKANAAKLGQFKSVKMGKISWPYTGPAAYGETVTFEYQPPAASK